MDLNAACWRKSSRSGSNQAACVEVATNLSGVVGVRDSKDQGGPVLVFAPEAWRAFVSREIPCTRDR
ncbi:DUF397 domain-containing protein [Plantactinospora endophytica]|uniref:DUF397 domain-containing protein n=1 Tax=Plantactinospora endophytica TaxID=673535 RepID=A0ABQ4E248_9ACTN|nr:DUF397 domain-containing protein [Plantactinospora endophytica]GIG88790.1 hypothetical protein Pen02_37260 [Plantactinospora endophytica]